MPNKDKHVINYRVVARVVGSLLLINGLLMLTALPVSWCFSGDDANAIFLSAGLTIFCGFGLWQYTSDQKNAEIKKREGYLIVALGWFGMGIFGTFPYLFSGAIAGFSDAFFESISGFTTTGASILTDIEAVPKGILFWRSMTQWIGGLGIIVLTIAVLPLLGIGGMELFTAESPGPTKDKIHPRIKETAKRLWGIYVVLTLTQWVALKLAGMSWYDAINHALTTCSTGGFSTKNASVTAFHSPLIEAIIIFYMFLAGTNFTLIYLGFKGKFKRFWQNDEFKWYFLWVSFLTIILTIVVAFKNGDWIVAFREVLFQVVSIVTTTGFASADYESWGVFVSTIFFLLLFSGGSAGSTSGSIKIVRIVLLMKNGLTEFKKRIHPKAVIPVKMNGMLVPSHIIYNLLAFIFLYLAIFVLGTVVMTLFNLDLLTASSAVATSLGNVGPGIANVGPTDNFSAIPAVGKLILALLMLIGRLELFTILVLFTPYFWRRHLL